MTKLPYGLLILLFGLVMTETYTKLLVFSENDQWIPLGKFTKSADITARVHISSKRWATIDKKLKLHLVAYTPSNWEKAINGKGCGSLLEYMSNPYELEMGIDGSWSNLHKLDFVEPVMYLAASICESPNISELTGHGIQFEINGCNYEPISQGDLDKLQGKTHPVPIERNQEPIIVSESSSRFLFFNTAAVSFFILTIIVFQIIIKGLFTRRFIFQFFILIGSIIARIVMHTIIIVDSYTEVEVVDSIIVSLDILSQFAFIFSSIITILGYLTESIGQSLISLILLSLIYLGLGFTKKQLFVAVLRGLLIGGAVGAFAYGLGKSEQPRSIKLASLITVIVYVLGLLLVEIDLLSCSPNSFILIDRFYVLKTYQNYSSPLHWIVEGDYLIQAIIMGVTLFVMGYLTRYR